MHAYRFAFLLCCGLIAACVGDKTAANGAQGDDGLPKPAAASGSVTGMPNPGVARPQPDNARMVEADALPEPVDAGDAMPVDPAMPPAPVEPPPVALPEPPSAQEPTAPTLPQPAPPPEA